MLSSKSAAAPVLNLKPSRILAAYIILGHSLAGSVLFYPMSLPVAVRMLIAIAVLMSFIYHWRTREPVRRLRAPLQDGQWLLQLHNGTEAQACLYGEYTVTVWLTVLRFKTSAKRKLTVVILKDSTDAEEARNMRVFLRQLNDTE